MNSEPFALAHSCLFGVLAFAPAFAQVDLPAANSNSVSADVSAEQPELMAIDSLPVKASDSKIAADTAEASATKEVKDVPRKQKQFALTFDDIKFDMKKTDKFDRKMLNDKINSYHGGKVKIRGYIRPNLKQDGIRKFIFVRDNKECCFGEGAAIFDNILVRMAKNKTTRYTVRPVTIEGNFVLKEYIGPDGDVWSLYRMYDAEVK